MKIKLSILFCILNFSILAVTPLPKVEKIENTKPWWLSSHEKTEGVLEGIGILNKNNEIPEALKEKAIALGKNEISNIKNIVIDSSLDSTGKSTDKNLNILTIGTFKEKNKAILIDTYEDNDNYYVYMAEFYNELAYNNFSDLLKEKNKKTQEITIETIKYSNKIVIKNKNSNKIILNSGLDKGISKNEILTVYRLSDGSINPITKSLNDFSREKIGEILVEEVSENEAIASGSLYTSFKIKTGDIAIKTGILNKQDQMENGSENFVKLDDANKSYNYNFNYEPQVLNVEKSSLLSPNQYEFSFMSDFGDRTNGQIKTGLFRFMEASIYLDTQQTFDLSGLIKVAFPVFETTNVGLAYKKELSSNNSYILGLFEQNFYGNLGSFNANYTSPIGEGALHESIGVSIQLKPNKNILIGTEYYNKKDNIIDDYLALKLNFKVIDDLWLGGGVIYSQEKKLFLKMSRVMIF